MKKIVLFIMLQELILFGQQGPKDLGRKLAGTCELFATRQLETTVKNAMHLTEYKKLSEKEHLLVQAYAHQKLAQAWLKKSNEEIECLEFNLSCYITPTGLPDD